MNTRSSLRARNSIRTRLLGLLLGLTVVSVMTTGFMGVNSILQTGQSAQRASSAALRDQAKSYLVQLTSAGADKYGLRLQNISDNARNLAEYTAGVLEHPAAFAPQSYWRARERMFTGPAGQYMNGPQDTSTVFVPKGVKLDEPFLTSLELSAYLDLAFTSIYASDPNQVAVYFISKLEYSRLYPNINLGTLIPPDYLATQDVFFTAGTPENNPAREVVWTPLYNDPAGQGLLVTAVAPVYTQQGEFLGVIGIDVSLSKFSADIESSQPLANGYAFLVNREGRAIALPRQGYQDILGRAPLPGEFGADLRTAANEFAPIITAMLSGNSDSNRIEVNGQELYVAYTRVAGTQWSLANVVETKNILQVVTDLNQSMNDSTQSLVFTRLLPISGIMLAFALGVGLWLTNRLISPLQKLAAAAQQIGAGKLDAEIPPTGDDEIGVLGQAFGNMTTQLRGMVGGLERRVAERTREVERRAEQIATGAEISRTASQLLNPDELLRTVTDLIHQRFDLYYVGIFVLDDAAGAPGGGAGRTAVLRAAGGPAGQAMLERGHALAVGGNSMVGWVCANKQARIALDVGQDPVRFANPLLPSTHSEIALPLRVGGAGANVRIIGVLDIQSTQEKAFDQNDITALQGMADQIAVALENARLFQQAQASLKEAELANRMLSGQGWRTFMHTGIADFAEFHQAGASPLTPDETARLVTGDATSEQRALVPLRVRDQVVGALVVERAPDQPEWSGADQEVLQAIADQTAQAMDSVRLFEESQRLAARERQTREIADAIRSAVSVEDAVQRAMREMGHALGAQEVVARLGSEETLRPSQERSA